MENGQTPLTEDHVALQGTIETFALPDVMRLLASTNKTGRLRVEGSRGMGNIWVDSGKIVAGEASAAPHADGPVEIIFELLRFKDGDFVFDADEMHSSPGDPKEVEAVLGEAEGMLEEWKDIEAVVPSLDSWVALASELPGSEVTIDSDRWSLIVAVAGGASVAALGDSLGLGEMPVSKRVKELIEAGLAELSDEPPASAAFAAPPERSGSLPGDTASVATSVADDDFAGMGSLGDEPADDFSFDASALIVEDTSVDETPSFGSEPELGDSDDSGSGVGEVTDAAEIARQLANLSPKAARAVAAAAKATTEEERELALADMDDEEDPINRDLLLKFLGSVNG